MNRRVRRIAVALDGSAHSAATLESGARLAAMLDAELFGFFVEDERLLTTGRSPAGAVVTMTGAVETVSSVSIERQMRAQATRIRAMFEAVVADAGVSGRFDVVRGRVDAAVRNAAMSADLVALGQTGWSPRGVDEFGSTAAQSVSKLGKPVLLARKGAALCTPIVVFLREDDAPDESLAIAFDLGRACGCPVTAVCDGDRAEAAASAAFEAAAAEPRVERIAPGEWASWLASNRSTCVIPWREGDETLRGLIAAAARLNSAVVLVPGRA